MPRCSQTKFPGSYQVWVDVPKPNRPGEKRKVSVWTCNPRDHAEEKRLAVDFTLKELEAANRNHARQTAARAVKKQTAQKNKGSKRPPQEVTNKRDESLSYPPADLYVSYTPKSDPAEFSTLNIKGESTSPGGRPPQNPSANGPPSSKNSHMISLGSPPSSEIPPCCPSSSPQLRKEADPPRSPLLKSLPRTEKGQSCAPAAVRSASFTIPTADSSTQTVADLSSNSELTRPTHQAPPKREFPHSPFPFSALKEKKKEEERMRAENASLKVEVVSLKRKREEEPSEDQLLKGENARLRSQVADLARELTSASEESKARDDISKQEISKLNEELRALKQTLEEAKKAHPLEAELFSKIADLKKQLRDSESLNLENNTTIAPTDSLEEAARKIIQDLRRKRRPG